MRMCVCVCECGCFSFCLCMCRCVCVWVHVYMCVCVCVCVYPRFYSELGTQAWGSEKAQERLETGEGRDGDVWAMQTDLVLFLILSSCSLGICMKLLPEHGRCMQEGWSAQGRQWMGERKEQEKEEEWWVWMKSKFTTQLDRCQEQGQKKKILSLHPFFVWYNI